MTPFEVHEGVAAPLRRANVDTDAILPKQYMKTVQRTGFADCLFDSWSWIEHDGVRRRNPEFVLNQPCYHGASILLVGDNFGCGSSREHAPWALWDAGFRVLIGTTFADIFRQNAINTGLLPISMPVTVLETLWDRAEAASRPSLRLEVDLRACRVAAPLEGLSWTFAIAPDVRERLLHGWDAVSLVLRHSEQVKAFEERQRQSASWLW